MQKIIVFDSGIGGFSVLREIVSQSLPVSVIYAADQANFPYGEREEEWLANRMVQVAQWTNKHMPAAFIVACNSATVSAVDGIRKSVSCPVIGVEPVVKPLASYSRALILATRVTTEAARTKDLIKEFGPHIKVEHANGLAVAIEEGDAERIQHILVNIAERVKKDHIEAIGLSCTHYPLVAHELGHLLTDVHIYDPSPAVVFQLKNVLSLDGPKIKPVVEFVTTGSVVRFKEQVHRYFGSGHSVGEWNV